MAINDNRFADYNSSGFTSSIVASKTYEDLSFSFIHPARGNVLISRDLEAVKNSVKNIVLTPVGTRPFFPEFGTRANTLLFEHFGFPTNIELENEIENAITRWEPRIKNLSVEAIPQEELNAYKITITFRPGFDGVYQLEFLLNRIR